MADHDAAAGVVSRILSEADMAARPGQYDRLVAIANEVAALSAEIAHERFHEMGNWRAFRETLLERDAALSEVAALREQMREGATWGHNIRREVLADLRAKVSRLTGRRPGDGTVWRADVLALIEEAQ